MRDYASKYPGRGAGGSRYHSGRRAAGAGPDRTMKIVGIMAVAAMLSGVAGSVWFGMALEEGLHSLEKGRQEQRVLQAENAELSARRSALMEQDRMEAAAKRLGLYLPLEKQIRRP